MLATTVLVVAHIKHGRIMGASMGDPDNALLTMIPQTPQLFLELAHCKAVFIIARHLRKMFVHYNKNHLLNRKQLLAVYSYT